MKKIDPIYAPQDIPLGLSMAMAQNALAFDTFARLSPVQKQKLIKDSHNAHSPNEMQQLVANMTDSGQASELSEGSGFM